MKRFIFLVTLFLVNIAFTSQNAKSQFLQMETSPRFENNYSYVATLLREIYTSQKDNFCFSPMSLYFPLAVMANGASGLTRQSLLSFLGVSSEEELNELSRKLIFSLQLSNKEPNVLTVANGIFTRSEPNQNFLKKIEPLNVLIDKLKSPQQINDWISLKTNGLIKDSIGKLSPDVRMLIINAIYFKGKWETPFDKEDTYSGSFFINQNSISKVKYMKAEVRAKYFESEEVSILKYDYVNSDVYALFILPSKKISIEEYINNNSYSKLNSYRLEMKNTNLRIHIPKINIKTKMELNPILQKLGLSRIFSDYGELVGLTNENLYVSNVSQVATLTVDESGAEAAAVTVVEFEEECCIITRYKEVKFDRPFFMSIYNENSDIPLFVSVINNPNAE